MLNYGPSGLEWWTVRKYKILRRTEARSSCVVLKDELRTVCTPGGDCPQV
uniref:Uncharacterized protein n=1 Tax=Arundo donax TaxID=35708 RepID=A0A0A9DUD6_ARUDO